MAESTVDVSAKYVVTTITIAANTTTQSTNVNLGERWLDSLNVFFRPGHAGLTGVRVLYGNVAVLPWNQPTTFLTGGSERREFEIGLHVSGVLVVTTQNLDKGYQHVFDLTWKVRELQLEGSPPVSTPLLASAAL